MTALFRHWIAPGARAIEAEWLDELPAADPRAVRSRRDLRRVNAWMLHARIMQRLLETHCETPPRTILDLGGGDGAFLLRLARRLSRRWPGVRATLVDRRDVADERACAAFRALGWSLRPVTADVFDYLARADARADVVVANLFLHHFTAHELVRMFARVSELACVLAACEPRRCALALAGSRLLWTLGCNDVSRHDARVSVRAGFSGHELSALWPTRRGWALEEARSGPFTHSFVARRDAVPQEAVRATCDAERA